MPRLRNRQPKLCFYPNEGYIVFCAGKRIRLGRDRDEAEERYRQIIAELNLQPTLPIRSAVTMAVLYDAWFTEHPQAHRRYVTGARAVLSLYANTPVHEFGPLAFKAVRAALFEGGNRHSAQRGKPICRGYGNNVMAAVKTVISWGVANELVPPHIIAAYRRNEDPS